MIYLLYFLLGLALLRSLLALIKQAKFWRLVPGQMREEPQPWSCKAAIIAPVKGVDPGFTRAIRCIAQQQFNSPYEIIFVVQDKSDPAATLIREQLELLRLDNQLIAAERIQIVEAGRCHDRGQKLHNQTEALQVISTDTEALAFVDSDGIPDEFFLANLCHPLQNKAVGATTGFRWYVPTGDDLASAWVSVWNSMALPMIAQRQAFVWGGAMAIRRDFFDELKIVDLWKNSVSDDLGVTQAIQQAHLRIEFVPKAMVKQPASFTWGSAWEFILRQSVITRIYARKVYVASLILNALQALVFFLGLYLAAVEEGWVWSLGVLMLYAFNVVYAVHRWQAVRILWPFTAEAPVGPQLSLIVLYPLFWAFNTFCLLTASLVNTIVWRGIRYRMQGPQQLTIEHLDRDN